MIDVQQDFGKQEPLKVRVQCLGCKDLNRNARRACKHCGHTGYVYIKVERNADGTIELNAEKLMKSPIIGSAPRPKPGEEQ